MMPVTVLITGGIGSGKSAVSSILESEGIPVYDSDSRTKALYDSDLRLRENLESLLGVSLMTAEGKFDRKLFASMIFANADVLREVENVVHPAVLEDFEQWRETALTRTGIVCMESAIALEKPIFRGSYDLVVMVDAPEQLRIERACRRDEADSEAIMARIRQQEIDFSKADYIIENNDSLSSLKASVSSVFEKIKAEMENGKLHN